MARSKNILLDFNKVFRSYHFSTLRSTYTFGEIVDYTEQEKKALLTGDHLNTRRRRFYYLFGLKRKSQKLRVDASFR